MANYENIKDYGFDKRTAKEQREIAVMGGKASGEARRRKADFRKTLNMLLTAKIDSEEWKPVLEALGVECTLESALNMAMIKEGLAGNVKAYEAIAKYAGQSNQTERDDEEKCKTIEQTAIEADPELYQYILEGVTTDYATYRYLKDAKKIPCGDQKYYRTRRKFYWLLSKKV